MKILMPDGTAFIERTSETMDIAKEVAKEIPAPPLRTRTEIAKELDEAELSLVSARVLVDKQSERVKKLTAELRGYGVKARGPRKVKDGGK